MVVVANSVASGIARNLVVRPFFADHFSDLRDLVERTLKYASRL
jgi:hypothetical protein